MKAFPLEIVMLSDYLLFYNLNTNKQEDGNIECEGSEDEENKCVGKWRVTTVRQTDVRMMSCVQHVTVQ